MMSATTDSLIEITAADVISEGRYEHPKMPNFGLYLIWAILAFLYKDLNVRSTCFLQIATFMRSGESKEIADTFHNWLE